MMHAPEGPLLPIDYGVAAATGSSPAAGSPAAEVLPATVSLEQLQQLLQDVWAAEAQAKQQVLQLLQQGEERVRGFQVSLQQQQQQSQTLCTRLLLFQQQLMGKGPKKESLAFRLQRREQQQLRLQQQLGVIHEAETCLLQVQRVQQQLAACLELLQQHQLLAAAAALQQCALRLLLPLLAATQGPQRPPAISQLQQQFAEVYIHLVKALDLRLQQHIEVSRQQLTVTPLLCSNGTMDSCSSSCTGAEAASDVAAAAAANDSAARDGANAAAAAAERNGTAATAAEAVLRLRDVWEALGHLGLLRRRLYRLTQSISSSTLQPLFAVVAAAKGSKKKLIFGASRDERGSHGASSVTWGWVAAAAEDTAAAEAEAKEVAEKTPQGLLPVLESLLQFVWDHAADKQQECMRTWAALIWKDLEQPLLQLLLETSSDQQEPLRLHMGATAAAAAPGGAERAVLPFLASAASAAGIVQMEQLLVLHGLQQQQPNRRAARMAAKWLLDVYIQRSIELLEGARHLLQQAATAGLAGAEQDTVLATENNIPGSLRGLLLLHSAAGPQQQEQKQQRLQLLQCIAEETDASLVQLAPLRITRQSWLLLQQLHGLLRAAAAAAARCSCNSKSSAVPCWCSSNKGRPGGCCTSSSCCCGRVAARAEVAAILSISDLFCLLRSLGPVTSPAATETAAPAATTVNVGALALRWTDTEVISRWLLRMPLLFAALAAEKGGGAHSRCRCSSSSIKCCDCPAAAARRAFSLLDDCLPLFDFDALVAAAPTSRVAQAAGGAAAAATATPAVQQHNEAPFRQQLAEISVALKRQQEETYLVMVKGLQQELQQASRELHELLTAAATSSGSSSSLEIHMEAAAGVLTRQLHSAALELLRVLPIQVRHKSETLLLLNPSSYLCLSLRIHVCFFHSTTIQLWLLAVFP